MKLCTRKITIKHQHEINNVHTNTEHFRVLTKRGKSWTTLLKQSTRESHMAYLFPWCEATPLPTRMESPKLRFCEVTLVDETRSQFNMCSHGGTHDTCSFQANIFSGVDLLQKFKTTFSKEDEILLQKTARNGTPLRFKHNSRITVAQATSADQGPL